jgi:DNA-binding CsgD family transcriptional regulator
MRVFSSTGCIKLGFFANTGRAKEFRAWAAKVLDGQVPVLVAPVAVSGRRGITRAIERQVFELFVAGLLQNQIAKKLAISPATVNLLLRAKYQFSYWAGAAECTPELITAVAARHLEVEQDKLLAAQERIVQTFCSHANNQQLADALDVVGQRLALPVLSGGVA